MRNLAFVLALVFPLAAHAFGPSFQAKLDGSLTATPGGEPLKTAGEVSYVAAYLERR